MSDKKVILMDVSSLLRTGIQGLLAEHGYQTAAQFPTIETMHSALPMLHADLIIMGSHGRTGVKKMMLGSVAQNVLTQSPVPVLIVKV